MPMYVLRMLFGKRLHGIYSNNDVSCSYVLPRTRLVATSQCRNSERRNPSRRPKGILCDPATRSVNGSGVKKATYLPNMYVSMTSLHAASDSLVCCNSIYRSSKLLSPPAGEENPGTLS